MADPTFDQQLFKMFAEPPALADASSFALTMQRRLDRDWTLRRVLISLAGAAGGGVAAAQFMRLNFLRQTAALSTTLAEAHRTFGRLLAQVNGPGSSLHNLPLGGEALWLIAGLVLFALVLVATRLIEEF